MLSLLLRLIVCGLLTFPFYLPANNGEDVTRPVRRFDLRVQGQTGASREDGNTLTLTLRNDSVRKFESGWQFALRLDAPFEAFRCSHGSDSSCYNSNHMGDSLAQAFIITPDFGPWCYAVGLKMIFPTAGKNLEIGNGKYQFLPSVAFRRDWDELSHGSYFGAIFRHDWSIAGYSIARRISETYIQPFVNISLPCQWFLNSSPEMFYDWLTHKWFVPLDLMIGKMLNPKTVLSLEYEYGLVYGYKKYRHQLEFRIGIFF